MTDMLGCIRCLYMFEYDEDNEEDVCPKCNNPDPIAFDQALLQLRKDLDFEAIPLYEIFDQWEKE